MTFLFALVGISAIAFSFALNHSLGIYDPIVFTLIGWGSVVVAYYTSRFMDLSRLFILNRHYEAYIVRSDGTFWNGKEWTVDGRPKLFYNDFQMEETLKFLHSKYGFDVDELYVKVILPESFFRRMEDEDDE